MTSAPGDGDDWDVTGEPASRRRKKGRGDETPMLPFADLDREPDESESGEMAKKSKKKASKKAAPKKAAAKKAPKKPVAKATKKVARKTTKRTTKKSGSGARGKSTSAAEASVTVKKRAYDTSRDEVQAELPMDDAPPPGASVKERKPKQAGPKNDPTIKAINRTAGVVHKKILEGHKPELKSPVRSLSNVQYKKSVGYFEIGRQRKVRTLSVNTVRTFAQSLRMMSLSKDMVIEDTFATKRDAYYQSKNWGDAKFNDQSESDTVMDDIEAMFSMDGVTREQLRFYPEEHGGAVAGELIVIDRDPVSGGEIEIDCTKFGSGAYTIPHSVEHLKFKTKAKFILCIETGGMFQRLQYHAYPSKAKCVIVSMGGVPTRACRRFVRRLSENCKIPVYAFVDCDPYGISNIYRSLKVGSGNAAHINKFFCVPKAHFLGVTPDDIVKYKLPTHPLKEVDKTRAKDALKNDPFFKTHKEWSQAIQKLLKMGVRAEQQALAKWGLNYVMEEYLPAKLKQTKSFLP